MRYPFMLVTDIGRITNTNRLILINRIWTPETNLLNVLVDADCSFDQLVVILILEVDDMFS